MEHIYIAPESCLTDNELVPYVANDDYQTISFLDYLSRYDNSGNEPRITPLSQQELDSFVQTCFFFALLRETLGPFFKHDEYLVVAKEAVDNARYYITTTGLISRLQKWIQHAKKDPSKLQAHGNHLEVCFGRIKPIWYGILVSKPSVSRIIRLFTMSILAILGAAVERDLLNRTIELPSVIDQSPNMIDIFHMVSVGGWCPFEAEKAWSSFLTVNTTMLLRSIKKPRHDDRHISCTMDTCVVAFPSMSQYMPQHLPSHCECKIFEIQEDCLGDIIGQGKTPVLRAVVDRSGELKSINLESVKKNTEYIAISHVWADGLGNPISNSLMACRIEDLIKKIIDALVAFNRRPRGVIYFWLDTLCVPVKPLGAKLSALAKMRMIYAEASHVLVLDSDIENSIFDEHDILISSTIIFTSRWIWRLWTLQEGLLASKLWFRFRNTTIELEELWKKLRDIRSTGSLNQYHIALDLLRSVQLIRHYDGRSWMDMKSTDLRTLQEAVQNRLVSVPSDEALCIATIAGFEVAINEDVPGRRMSLLWQRCAKKGIIEQNIVFNRFPRLSIPGYQWAPATLLNHHILRSERDYCNFPPCDKAPAVLSTLGLCVRYPGLTMKPHRADDTCQSLFKAVAHAGFPFALMLDKVDNVWYAITLHGHDLDGKLASMCGRDVCALIVDTSTSRATGIVSLLVISDGAAFLTVKSIVRTRLHVCGQARADRLNDSVYDAGGGRVYGHLQFWESHRNRYEDGDSTPWMQHGYDLCHSGHYFQASEHFENDKPWIVD